MFLLKSNLLKWCMYFVLMVTETIGLHKLFIKQYLSFNEFGAPGKITKAIEIKV